MNLATIIALEHTIQAGGPGSGRHPEGEQFHGTAVKTIKSILKNGILPTDATLGYKAAFVTNSKDLAFSYGVGAAARAGKLKGAVVAIAVIKDPVKAGITMVDGKSNLSVSKDGIKPEFIDRVEVYNWDAKKGDAPVKVIRASSSSGNNAYITLLIHSDIKAGGPGSGCNGPNCGRPEKKYNGPEGKSAAERGGNAPAPFYKKSMDKQSVEQEKAGQKEMRQWRQQQPLAKSTSTVIQKGDEVKTLKVTRAFDNNKLEFKNYKPGTTLTVMEVLPKVGNNPQLMSVQYPQGDMVHMSVDDARLHKTLEGIQEKPAWKIRQEIGLAPDNVRPGRIAQQTETSTGARYTQLKPVTEGRPTGSGNVFKNGQPNPDEHSLKGSFNVASGPKGNKLSDIFTFEISQKAIGQNNARATVWDANKNPKTPAEAKNGTEGTTVIAWRDTKDKSGRVMEFEKDANGYIKQGSKPMQSFNNLGHMGTYLKQRYGISMKLPGDSVARKKK